MGEFSRIKIDQRMECTRRADEESVCAGSERIGVELGVGGGGVGEFVLGGDWDRDGWIDCVAFDALRNRGDEADGGAVEPLGDHSNLAHAGYGRADGAD